MKITQSLAVYSSFYRFRKGGSVLFGKSVQEVQSWPYSREKRKTRHREVNFKQEMMEQLQFRCFNTSQASVGLLEPRLNKSPVMEEWSQKSNFSATASKRMGSNPPSSWLLCQTNVAWKLPSQVILRDHNSPRSLQQMIRAPQNFSLSPCMPLWPILSRSCIGEGPVPASGGKYAGLRMKTGPCMTTLSLWKMPRSFSILRALPIKCQWPWERQSSRRTLTDRIPAIRSPPAVPVTEQTSLNEREKRQLPSA